MKIPIPNSIQNAEELRKLLCNLGDAIREAVCEGKRRHSAEELSGISEICEADTIYSIDRFSEKAIQEWLESHWPAEEPVELVMEGLEGAPPPIFPSRPGNPLPHWRLIVDPIDGTRGIMYDKRSAWALAGLAPAQQGKTPRLSDIFLAAMTEIPVSKQAIADQFSCVRGQGIVAEAVRLSDQSRSPLRVHPSRATSFEHGFSSLVKFFPEGRALTAQIEERLWKELLGPGPRPSPVIFDDQYLSTGGQFYELLVGHDRMIGDLRPWVHRLLGLDSALVCHPYDACAWPLLAEAGVIFLGIDGDFPDAPMDTTSPVGWIAFANKTLAEKALPALQKILREIEAELS